MSGLRFLDQPPNCPAPAVGELGEPKEGQVPSLKCYEHVTNPGCLPRPRPLACLLAVGLLLTACDTPVGVAPNLRGTYWEHARVTNPNGGGPQVVIWGPPDPSVSDGAG